MRLLESTKQQKRGLHCWTSLLPLLPVRFSVSSTHHRCPLAGGPSVQALSCLRAFARADPFAWKALPADVCMLQSLTSSTSLIKCHTLGKVTFSPDLSLPSSAGRPTEGLAEGSVKDSQHRGISREEKRQACAAHLLCARL